MAKQALAWRAVYFSCFVLLACCDSNVPSPHNQEQVSTTHSDVPENSKNNSTTNTSTEHSVIKYPILRSRRNTNLDNKNIFNREGNRALRSVFQYNDQIMRNLLQNHSPKSLNYARSNFFLNLLKPLDRRTTRYSSWDDHSVMHFGKRSVDGEETSPVIDKEVSLSDSSESPITTSESNEESADLDKRSPYDWSDHNVMHFGKRSEEDSRPENINGEAKSNDDADDLKTWNSIQEIDKKSENPWDDHNTMHFGKRPDDPWHSMMSFGKRGENPFGDHNTMHFGKRGESPFDDHNTMHFGKRDDDPWHSMMSFGKRGENPFGDHNTMHFGKREDDPWHSMMSFGKRGENPFGDHNTMHFGKRDDEPWHSMMSFGKKSENPFNDHSTMHFGKRDDDPWHSMMSFGKRSEDSWENHNTLHFGKKSGDKQTTMDSEQNSENSGTDQSKVSDTKHIKKRSIHSSEFNNADSGAHDGEKNKNFKSKPGTHAKKLKKRNDPWDNHNTLHFGKKSMWWMSPDFGKKFDPWNTHNAMHFGKKANYWDTHNTMHFGKRSELKDSQNIPNSYKSSKVKSPDNNEKTDKTSDVFEYNINDFNGMLDDKITEDNYKSYGNEGGELAANNKEGSLRSPDHTSASKIQGTKKILEKRSTNKLQKRSLKAINSKEMPARLFKVINSQDLRKMENSTPVTNEMINVKTAKNKATNSTRVVNGTKDIDGKKLHVSKRSVEQMPMEMSENKQNGGQLSSQNRESENSEEEPSTDIILRIAEIPDEFQVDEMRNLDNSIDKQNSQQAGSKYEQFWSALSRMSSNKKFDPWSSHNTMHFGKRFDPLELHNTMHFGKKNDPWNSHNTMHFGKKADPWESHNTLHFGKRTDPWDLHNTMHFGKKAAPWESHNTLHFGKKSDPWESHNTMHFGKKSNPWESHNTLHFGKKFDPWDSHNTMHFGKRSDLWESHNTMHFGKRSSPWDSHNTMHFGKKSDPWENHNTLHFGKKSDPWENHNTLHFGKKSDPWELHNTMHFGKKSDPWENHNTLHFGKRDGPDESASDMLVWIPENENEIPYNSESINSKQQPQDSENKYMSLTDRRSSSDNPEVFGNSKNILSSEGNPTILFDGIQETEFPLSDLTPLFQLENHNGLDKDGMFFLKNLQDRLSGDINSNDFLRMLDKIQLPSVAAANKLNDDDGLYLLESPGNGFSNNNLKIKQKLLKKPDTKRYWAAPFQGPKSIVYPHAWLASQIRRSVIPKSIDQPRIHETRTAEKKEDPVNSFMHFGRR